VGRDSGHFGKIIVFDFSRGPPLHFLFFLNSKFPKNALKFLNYNTRTANLRALREPAPKPPSACRRISICGAAISAPPRFFSKPPLTNNTGEMWKPAGVFKPVRRCGPAASAANLVPNVN